MCQFHTMQQSEGCMQVQVAHGKKIPLGEKNSHMGCQLFFFRGGPLEGGGTKKIARIPPPPPPWVYGCSVVWCGVVWCGVVWCGVVWCGVVWCGVVWCGVVWCGVACCGMLWCGVVCCGVVCCGVACCAMVCCTVLYCGVVHCVGTKLHRFWVICLCWSSSFASLESEGGGGGCSLVGGGAWGAAGAMCIMKEHGNIIFKTKDSIGRNQCVAVRNPFFTTLCHIEAPIPTSYCQTAHGSVAEREC